MDRGVGHSVIEIPREHGRVGVMFYRERELRNNSIERKCFVASVSQFYNF